MVAAELTGADGAVLAVWFDSPAGTVETDGKSPAGLENLPGVLLSGEVWVELSNS